MKALDLQNQMNKALANRSFKKAYKLFTEMNVARLQEGLDYLTMPNLQARFGN